MRIIVVDDEPSNIGEIKDMIQRTGRSIDATYYTNPIEALEITKNEEFDVALLDIQMPLMNGLELAERILKYISNIKVVFITAYNYYATEAFDVNAFDYLLKPLRYERFEKVLNKILDKTMGEKLICKILGEAKIRCRNKDIKWNRPKTYELFSFLLLNKEKKCHKYIICEALWPELDEKKALSNLQVTMCRLRKNLECLSKKRILIVYSHNFYVMHTIDVWVDVDEFMTLTDADDIINLEKAFKLYTGELFSGEYWQWAIVDREFYRRKAEEVLFKLIEHYYALYDYLNIINLIESYIPIGLPNERISEYYLSTINQLKDIKRDCDATILIENWYKKELDMSVPKDVKRYSK
jgi:two-component SAPR family response regulator